MGCVSSAPLPKKSRFDHEPESDPSGSMGNNSNKIADKKRIPGSPNQTSGQQPHTVGAGLPATPAESAPTLAPSLAQPQPGEALPQTNQTVEVAPSAPPQPSVSCIPVRSPSQQYNPYSVSSEFEEGPPELAQVSFQPYDVSSEFEVPPAPPQQPPVAPVSTPEPELPSYGYTEAEFMLSEYGIENWDEIKAKKEAKKRWREQEQARKALERAERAASRSKKLCRHFGSARGCRNGDACQFSHDNPNSCPKCKHFPYCRKGKRCGFRHHDFVLVNGAWIAQEETY